VPHRLSLPRPVHAGPHQRRQVVRGLGGAGAGDRGRHRERGARIEAPGPGPRRPRVGLRRLAIARGGQGRRRAQARPQAGAGLDRAGRARDARHDRLRGPARHRAAQAGRDGGGLGRLRRGGLGGGADRQDQGLPRGRHRGVPGQVRLRGARARVRRLRELQDRRPARVAQGGLPERHRRLLRERGRRRAPGRDAAAQHERAHPALGLVSEYNATDRPRSQRPLLFVARS
jgi:hypothetical protein